jgi:hypothetical protein
MRKIGKFAGKIVQNNFDHRGDLHSWLHVLVKKMAFFWTWQKGQA